MGLLGTYTGGGGDVGAVGTQRDLSSVQDSPRRQDGEQDHEVRARPGKVG